MNSQERSVLEAYLDRLVQVRTVDKDAEADAMIRRAVRRQPDAAYLVVRRALLLERALDQSRARIADLERAHTTGGTRFLDPSSTGASHPQASGAPLRSAADVSLAYPPAAGPLPSSAGGASSFLGQAAATAAGVAGGAFLIEGLESMLDHHGTFEAGQPAAAMSSPEDVTINNYYAGADRSEGDQQSSEWDSQLDSPADLLDDDDYMI